MSKPPKVLFTGPESCGKTTLSQWLHEQEGWTLVTEAARDYLTESGPAYTEQDVLAMSRLQWVKEYRAASRGQIFICDTDLLTYIIWQKERFGRVDAWIEATWKASQPDLCFLCMPDIPWEEDVLRENALDRDRLVTEYQKILEFHHIQFVPVFGSLAQRKKSILAALTGSHII